MSNITIGIIEPAVWSAIAALGSFMIAALALVNTISNNLQNKKRNSPNVLLTRREYKIKPNDLSFKLFDKVWFNQFLTRWFNFNELNFNLLITSQQPIYDVNICITPSKNTIDFLENEYKSLYTEDGTFKNNNDNLLFFPILERDKDLQVIGFYLTSSYTTKYIYYFNEKKTYYFSKIAETTSLPLPKSVYAFIYGYYLNLEKNLKNNNSTNFQMIASFDLDITYFNKYESKTQYLEDTIDLIITYEFGSFSMNINLLNKSLKPINNRLKKDS